MNNLLNTPKLETKRLILRSFEIEDVPFLYNIFRDKEVNTFLPWFPLNSLEEAKIFYENRYVEVYKQPIGYKYAVCLKSDNIPIGYVNVSVDESHDLGYGLRKEYWHKGIITEACKAVLNQIKDAGFEYITATHDVNNPRSGNVMKNLGMTYCYSYVEQWQPKNFPVTFRMYQLNFDDKNCRIFKKYWNESINHFVEKDII
ncbi:GNAT family N-acetyltransferase [Candidatus Gastranaerophilales bacterium]|nr:MAG: GNAT family N-acetyltransferase [Candidatus Gastranaerophilales bacterium]